MMLRFVGLLIGSVWAVQASADVAGGPVLMQQISQCVAQTGAPGSYEVTDFETVPAVAVSQGGTEIGAHNVNDCLKDSYNVQYSSGAFGLPAGEFDVMSAVGKCRDERNSTLFVGTAATTGVWLLLGGHPVGGVFWGLIFSNPPARSNFEACLLETGVYQYAGREFAFGCSRDSDVLHGGSQYCRR